MSPLATTQKGCHDRHAMGEDEITALTLRHNRGLSPELQLARVIWDECPDEALTVRSKCGGLLAEWHQQGLSLEMIGRRVGCSRQRVHQILRRFYPMSTETGLLTSREAGRICGIRGPTFRRLALDLGETPVWPGTTYSRSWWTGKQVGRVRKFLASLSCPRCGRRIVKRIRRVKGIRRRCCSTDGKGNV